MSHINSIKNRLGEMFLRDRGKLDENTAMLVKSEVRRTLEAFFAVSDYAVSILPCDDGEISVEIKMKGIRLGNFR